MTELTNDVDSSPGEPVVGGRPDANLVRNNVAQDIARVAKQGSVSPEGPLGKVTQAVFNDLLPDFADNEAFREMNLSHLVVPESADASGVYVVTFELNKSTSRSPGSADYGPVSPVSEEGRALIKFFRSKGYVLIPDPDYDDKYGGHKRFGLVVSHDVATRMLESGEAEQKARGYKDYMHRKYTLAEPNPHAADGGRTEA